MLFAACSAARFRVRFCQASTRLHVVLRSDEVIRPVLEQISVVLAAVAAEYADVAVA